MKNSAAMLRIARTLVVVLCACLLAGVTYWAWNRPAIAPESANENRAAADSQRNTLSTASSAKRATDDTLSIDSSKDSVVQTDEDSDDEVNADVLAAMAQGFEDRLGKLIADIESSVDPQVVREELRRLKAEMLAAPPTAAAMALRSFLASRQDAATGLPFLVGVDGTMGSVPSLRDFAIDVLPSVDPDLAVTVGREILDQGSSVSESSLALRNLAWNDLNGDMAAELTERFTKFLNNEAWAQKPSEAYLEAFDIAVELASPALFEQLAAIVARNVPAGDSTAANLLGHAAFIALDRQVVKDRGILVNALTNNPEFLATAPMARASLMSRLDITVESERAALVEYLGAADRSSKELNYFGKLYPNGNYFHGNWMVTASEVTPAIGQQRVRDRAALAEIDRMLAASPAERVRQTLLQVREHLQSFEHGAQPENGGLNERDQTLKSPVPPSVGTMHPSLVETRSGSIKSAP